MKKLLVLLVVFVLAGVVSADTTTGLIGWWKMDETSGTDVIDSSGNGFDGYFDGSLAWTGGSLDFTGGKVAFDTAAVESAFSSIDRQMTVSFWVKLDKNSRCDMYYIKDNASGSGITDNHIEIGGNGSQDTWCYCGEGGNRVIEWGTNVADNDNFIGYQDNWRLVTLVKDADGGELIDPNDPGLGNTGIAKLYINGVVVASATANPSWVNDNYMNLGVAGNGIDKMTIGGAGSPIDGQLKDFRVYDRALTDADVLELAGTDCDDPQCLYPADGQGSGEFDMLLGVDKLHWLHGARAASYDIYLGTDETAVTNATTADAEFLVNVEGTVYAGDVNNPLDINTPGTYYWRVDAVGADANDVWSSEVISFVIDPPPSAVDPLAWWKMDQTDGSTVMDYSGNEYHAEKHSSVVWENDGRYGNLHFKSDWVPTQVMVDVNTATEMFSEVDDQLTIAFWVKRDIDPLDVQWLYKSSPIGTPGTPTYGSIYCEYPSYNGGWWHMGRADKMTHYGNYNSFVEYWTHWIICKNTNTGLMKLYKNGDLVMTATDKVQSLSGVTYWSIGVGSDITQWRWFNGHMRDFRLYDKELPDFQIEDLPGEYLYIAKKPDPADGQEDIDYNYLLSWEAGKNSVAHDVYFGESESAVTNADVNSAVYMGQFATNSFDPCELPLMKTYYWRVDEIDDEGVLYKGDVWSFSTIQYIMVEDFESYDADGNDITAVWDDKIGWGDIQITLTSDDDTFVLNGINSMKLRYHVPYDPYYAIAARSFSPAQDWTQKGVKMLTLNCYGSAENFDLPVFITVGDGTTDANIVVEFNTKSEGWGQLNVSLPEIAAAGVDIANVTYLEIGFGDGTNLGMSSSAWDVLYVDDISLYPSKCVLSESSLKTDVTGDCLVNYEDLDETLEQWLVEKDYYSFSDAVSALGTSPVGLWLFDDSGDLLDATIGPDLTTSGTAYEVDGITDADGAATVAQGDYFICTHGIAPEAGDEKVFTYTLVFNIYIPSELRPLATGSWISLVSFRGSPNNGDLFLRPSGIFGIGDPGYSAAGSYNDDEWFQLVLVSEKDTRYEYYVNGDLILAGPTSTDRHGLLEDFSVFSDFDGDHQDIPVRLSSMALYDVALSSAEIKSLTPASVVKGNFNTDTVVDFKDYSILADEWLVEDLWP